MVDEFRLRDAFPGQFNLRVYYDENAQMRMSVGSRVKFITVIDHEVAMHFLNGLAMVVTDEEKKLVLYFHEKDKSISTLAIKRMEESLIFMVKRYWFVNRFSVVFSVDLVEADELVSLVDAFIDIFGLESKDE